MSKIKIDLLSRACQNLVQDSTSKFWGLLCVLSAIDGVDKVAAGVTYKINTIKLSENLERLFYYGDKHKLFSDSSNYVTFSNQWSKKASDNFIHNSVSIKDAALFFNIDTEISEGSDISSIVNKFIAEIKLSTDDIEELFDTNYNNEANIVEANYSKQALWAKIKTALDIETDNATLTMESPYTVISHPAELSRAPFIQTLYAAQSNFECLLLTKFNFNELYNRNNTDAPKNKPITNLPQQRIYFGAPGTGKSHAIKKEIKDTTNKTIVTFHPDSDYSSFVGSYKPAKDKNDNITYRFVPQAFAKAYVAAWRMLLDGKQEPYFLVIEEINRGSCAQIFGDVFQLLDRADDGFSEYVVDIDDDFAQYLEEELGEYVDYQEKIAQLISRTATDDKFSYSKIALPSNLSILATMNTSDQSLFPMDSAFKRRWEWEYMPINSSEVSYAKIEIGDKEYSWSDFINKINKKIMDTCKSEDKQLGAFFIKVSKENPVIKWELFRSKAMSFLWFDVYKDLYESDENTVFRTLDKDENKVEFSFGKLFEGDEDTQKALLQKFMEYNKIALFVEE